MSAFLLDTNVPSELTRLSPNKRISTWVTAHDDLHLSVISIGELQKGLHLLSPGKRRVELEEWLENFLLPLVASKILPVTQQVAERWGALAAERRLQGVPLAVEDGLIAATALVHGLTLVTRNVKDFAGLGLDILDLWEL